MKINLPQAIQVLANFGLIAGIPFFAIEMHQNSEHLRLQLEDQINARLYEQDSIFLSENPAPIIEKSLLKPGDMTYTEYRVMDAYLGNIVSGWEDRFFLYKAGLITEAEWKTFIDQNASWYFGNRFAKIWWAKSGKEIFATEFVEYVDSALSKIGDGESYKYWRDIQARMALP